MFSISHYRLCFSTPFIDIFEVKLFQPKGCGTVRYSQHVDKSIYYKERQ